jgi:hypothetical protein
MAGKPRIDPSVWPSIVARYQAGEMVDALCAEHSIGRDAIYKILRRSGVEVEKRGGAPETPPEIEVKIIAAYISGEGATTVAAQFGVNKRTVYNILNRASVGTRPRHDRVAGDLAVRQKKREALGHKRGPRVPFREGAFAVLTDEVAYWLGYLTADGCVSIDVFAGKSPRLMLVQSRAHRCQCERMKAFLGCANPVEDYQSETFGVVRDFSRLQVTSQRLADDLKYWGIRPAKTGTVGVHPDVKDNAHFWRGVIDGDGSPYVDRLHCYSSSPRVANGFRRYARRNGLRKLPAYFGEDNEVWYVQATGSDGRTLSRLLYANAPKDLRLADKYDNAMENIRKTKTTRPR